MEMTLANQIEIIGKMAENEELIGELYSVYEKRFPEMGKLWAGLAKEEADHAQLLTSLVPKIKDRKVYFDAQRFKIEAIETFSHYVKREIASGRNESLSGINALSVSFDVENALLESKYLETFESDSAEFKSALNYLKIATEEHRKRVKASWEEERKRLGIR